MSPADTPTLDRLLLTAEGFGGRRLEADGTFELICFFG